MPSPKRILKITGIVALILAVLLIVAGRMVSARLEQKITEQLQAAGFQVRSVSISFLKRAIELDSLAYEPVDTVKNPHQLTLQRIRIRGIHIYSFLANNELVIDHVIVNQGSLHYNKNFKVDHLRPDKSPGSLPKVTSFRINYLSVTHVNTTLLADTIPESVATIVNLEVNGITCLFKDDTTYSIGPVNAELKNLQSEKCGLHSFSISRIDYNSREGHMQLDSFRIIPRYNKDDFARIARIQKTRLDVIVPKIMVEGIKQQRLFTDTTLEIARIKIPKPVVHAYRDKRYPFVRDWIMPLPIEGIRRLPFKLKIDSIVIDNAAIAYEEFSEKGLPKTGTITFNKLDASFSGLSTESKQPDKDLFCTLTAECRLMNSGWLHATFKLPLNPAVNYQAYGNLRNMDLKSLNPALGNLARVEISDGTLNDLRFNFFYNDDVSKGEVLINYKDLKLEILKKEKNSRETNKLLTAAVNAIIKSDKDKSVDKSKRTGIIDIERDKKRFVFQFWWKSMLDGLQSTFTDNGKKKKTRKESSK